MAQMTKSKAPTAKGANSGLSQSIMAAFKQSSKALTKVVKDQDPMMGGGDRWTPPLGVYVVTFDAAKSSARSLPPKGKRTEPLPVVFLHAKIDHVLEGDTDDENLVGKGFEIPFFFNVYTDEKTGQEKCFSAGILKGLLTQMGVKPENLPADPAGLSLATLTKVDGTTWQVTVKENKKDADRVDFSIDNQVEVGNG